MDKDDGGGENAKFQKLYQNHQSYKILYPELKPLTILVTRKYINEAKKLDSSALEFLADRLGEGKLYYALPRIKLLAICLQQIAIIDQTLLCLPHVDSKDDKSEWIISVAMLTEGWDVKNVFMPLEPPPRRRAASKAVRAIRSISPTVYSHVSWAAIAVPAAVAEVDAAGELPHYEQIGALDQLWPQRARGRSAAGSGLTGRRLA